MLGVCSRLAVVDRAPIAVVLLRHRGANKFKFNV